MKLLFLRGKVDERTELVRQLKDTTDLWEHLACAMTSEMDNCKILYWGGNRKVYYADNITVEYVHSFKHWNTLYEPDVIFARGNFPEYVSVLKMFPNAFKILYGAGIRTFPMYGMKYDMVLVDTQRDYKKIKNALLWNKPAAPNFVNKDIPKEFDVCYIANGQQAKIKNIKWVYKTIPSDMSMLHLGYLSKYKSPKNVVCKRVSRWNMPDMINRCKVGIVPYTSYDSAPRAASEMLACGLPVISLDETRSDITTKASKENFWKKVTEVLNNPYQRVAPSNLKQEAKWIKDHIGGI